MRHSLFLLALAAAMAMLALPALAEEEEEAIADYLAYYEQMGVSDSLLTQLEANIRQATRDSTWVAQHIEIQRLIMIEYRLNKLRHLAETGTASQKAAADAKIEEILAAEEARQ